MTTPSRSHMSYDVYDCEKYHEKFVKKTLQQRGAWLPKKTSIASSGHVFVQQQQQQQQHVLLYERHTKNTPCFYSNPPTLDLFFTKANNDYIGEDFDWINEVLCSGNYDNLLHDQILPDLGTAEVLSFSMTNTALRKSVMSYYENHALPALIESIDAYNRRLMRRARNREEYKRSFVDLRKSTETVLGGIRVTYVAI